MISHDPEPDDLRGPLPRTRLPVLSRRRQLSGMFLALLGLPVVTAVMVALRERVELSTVVLVYLSLCVAVAATGGLGAGLLAAVGGVVLANFFFTKPYHSVRVHEPQIVVALVVFVVVAAVVSLLVDLVARRAAEAARAHAESAALARLGGALLRSDDPLPQLVHDLRVTFGLDAAAILRSTRDRWTVEASAGEPVPATPGDGSDALPLAGDVTLVLSGPRLPADDRRVLAAFAAQLAVAVAAKGWREEAADASVLARTNELRAALLAAVSHDLRTPLASIKASVTSLLQGDVDWPSDAREEFLLAIDAEADRLNSLVGNLLDMSRLQTGAVETSDCPVGLDEVVPAALLSLQYRAEQLEVDVPETLPRVHADPALLERVVANLIANALQWSPPGETVRVHAGAAAGRVDLTVADRGPGIPLEDRDRVFEPFQRLGDGRRTTGVGLGLAVSRGFIEAMHGELLVQDTPGGGTTMIVSLPAENGASR